MSDLLRDAVKVWLLDQDTEAQREAINAWSQVVGRDDWVYESIDEVGEVFTGVELARAVYFGRIDNWFDCVQFNGYGNLESWHGMSDGEASEVAEWLMEYQHMIDYTEDNGTITVHGIIEQDIV